MTMEAQLKRIADSLEAIAASQGIVSGELPPAEEPKAPAKKKVPAKKKAAKKTVGKPKEEVETELTIKGDVRPVLKRLRDEVSQAAVKSLLKKHGASTVQQLEPAKYQAIIDDAKTELGIDDDDL